MLYFRILTATKKQDSIKYKNSKHFSARLER